MVLAVAGVADEVQGFDGPVAAVERGQVSWAGVFGGVAGDAELCGGGLFAVVVGDVAFD